MHEYIDFNLAAFCVDMVFIFEIYTYTNPISATKYLLLLIYFYFFVNQYILKELNSMSCVRCRSIDFFITRDIYTFYSQSFTQMMQCILFVKI